MPIIPDNQFDKKTTLDDVALLAGVARITVSRVVNQRSASRETRERVLLAIAKLGYQPNRNARDLKHKKSMRLALLFLREGTPHVSPLLTGVLAQPANDNLHITVAPCRSVRDACEEARRLVQNGTDGFMLPVPLCDQAELVQQIERAGAAIVSLSSAGLHSSRSAVSVSEFGAAFAMTRHLIGLGHRHIGFIKGAPGHAASAQLLDGYRCALEAHRIAYDDALVAGSVLTYRSGLDAAEWLIRRANRPTAIFASNDETAVAAMAVADRAGIEVPSDLTVAGFGDTALATMIWPALTTVRLPTELMVERAVDILARQIRQLRVNGQCAREQAILDFELIRRQSDAPPRARPPATAPCWSDEAVMPAAPARQACLPAER